MDEQALLATCTYIDLNPVAAGIAAVPEASAHTSIKERVDHIQVQGRAEDLKAARSGSVGGSAASAGLEESHWLCPIEDRRRLDSAREGMVEGFSLGNYLHLVDYTARLYRAGKAAMSREVAAILDRLGSTALEWQARLEKLRLGRFLGRYFATTGPDSRRAGTTGREAHPKSLVFMICMSFDGFGRGPPVERGGEAGEPLARRGGRARGCHGWLRPGRSADLVTAIVPDGVGLCHPTGRLAAQAKGNKGVPSFSKRDGLYGVQIITGPRSVLLRLELLDERIEGFEVAAYTTEGLYRDPTPGDCDRSHQSLRWRQSSCIPLARHCGTLASTS